MSETHSIIAATDIFTDLVIALLSVNSWPLEKSAELLPGLQEQLLTSPANVSEMDFPEVFSRLKAAGYTRSDYVVSLLTERLLSVAKGFKANDLQRKLLVHEQACDITAIRDALEPLRGVGPRVLENFLLLRGLM